MSKEPREAAVRHDDACRTISALYPPDSEYADTRAIGRELLLDALCEQWRSLPTDVLDRLAALNLARENG